MDGGREGGWLVTTAPSPVGVGGFSRQTIYGWGGGGAACPSLPRSGSLPSLLHSPLFAVSAIFTFLLDRRRRRTACPPSLGLFLAALSDVKLS